MASTKLTDLLPAVSRKAQEFKTKCKAQGIDIIFTCTYRSPVEQDMLYLQPYDGIDNNHDGIVDNASEKVTNAKAGESLHNWKCAFDVVPVVQGKAIWSNSQLWAKLGSIGQSIGLEWGGSWTSFKDQPHFQYTLGYTWQDFKAGKVDITKFN